MKDAVISTSDIDRLVQSCMETRKYSYSPYSHFRVGAALLDIHGKIWTGVNVENCAYSPGICAERTALVKAISEGSVEFVAIAISSDLKDEFIYPCGVCRQFMAEFGLDLVVIVTKSDGSYMKLGLSQLLPSAFIPSTLSQPQQQHQQHQQQQPSTTTIKSTNNTTQQTTFLENK